ncbi:MAG: DUF115 domain-containing protein [Thermoplasmata archaeon]|nr:DUF115 domain-containing protein [Thermoplasmata archaeon]
MPPVEYRQWAPVYARIAAEFGFPFAREQVCAERLRELLPPGSLEAPEERLRRRLAGRPAIVVGLAPGSGTPPLWRLPPSPVRPAVLAADGATERCLAAGIVPDVIVTDLDGPVPAEVSANSQGAIAVVHAHGDNLASVERWVPQFPGELVGSWAGAPERGLVDFGGFTDGDRAAYLAVACGATRVLLFGFDFVRVDEPDSPAAELKRAKLRCAEQLLRELAAGEVPVHQWRADGTQEPTGA